MSPATIVANQREDLATASAAASATAAEQAGFTRLAGALCPALMAPAQLAASVPVTWDPDRRGIDTGTLLCPAGDLDAQRLAERVAFLPLGFARSITIPADEFDFHLQTGSAGGFLVPLPREYATSCLLVAAMLARASWLEPVASGYAGTNSGARGGATLTSITQRLRQNVIPLVYTSPFLVTRGTLAGVTLAYDGVPLLGAAGWAQTVPEAQP
jgi:hypothetical protein